MTFSSLKSLGLSVGLSFAPFRSEPPPQQPVDSSSPRGVTGLAAALEPDEEGAAGTRAVLVVVGGLFLGLSDSVAPGDADWVCPVDAAPTPPTDGAVDDAAASAF